MNLRDNYSVPISELAFDFENEALKVRMYVNIISGSYEDMITLKKVTIDMLITIKE